jgi:glycosyltransferase involved in cell wall biosynthesis
MSKSLLFLSYLFPPRGGAGVQRSLKFAKYLPQYRWRPLIVANGGTAEDNVTKIQDPTLLKDLPVDTVVRYTSLTDGERRRYYGGPAKGRRRLAATDPMGWWVEPAVRTALELAREHEPRAIFVTMSPFTAAEAGIRLKRRLGLPLILDLRDPWALDETKIYPTSLHAWLDWKAMHRALSAADLVIMNTPEAARAVSEAFGLAPTTRVVSLTNGFDADDFTRASGVKVEPAPHDVLRVVHTGMFHSELARVWDRLFQRKGIVDRIKYPRRLINLWSRTPRYLLEAIERLVRQRKVPANKIEVVLVGELTEGDKALAAGSVVHESVRVLGYRTHEESVAWVKSADVLFLPLHTPLDGGSALIVPGKAYEYLGSGRPVLAMGPPGDMRNFVREARAGFAVGGDDVAGAEAALAKLYRAKVEGKRVVEADSSVVAWFERRELSRRLAEELDATVGERAVSRAEEGRSPRPSPGVRGEGEGAAATNAEAMLAAGGARE